MGHGSPYGCETSRFPHFLDNWLTDGGEVVSLTRQPPFTPREIPGTHFCQRLSWPQGHSVAGRTRSIEKFNNVIGNSIVPQPTTLPRAPYDSRYVSEKNWHPSSTNNESRLPLVCLRRFSNSTVYSSGSKHGQMNRGQLLCISTAPDGSIQFWEFLIGWTTVGLWRTQIHWVS
jgi:hypothetical protein